MALIKVSNSGFSGLNIQHFRLGSDYDIVSANTEEDLTDWDELNSSTQGFIGSSISETNGVFSFSQTGIYLIDCYFTAQRTSGDVRFASMEIKSSVDGGSNYTTISSGLESISSEDNSSIWYGGGLVRRIQKISDTTNQRIKFMATSSSSACVFKSSENRTNATFMRLGDI